MTRFVDIDCALAAEKILIAAKSLGPSSHIMSMTELLFASWNGEELSKSLGVPDPYQHISMIALGYEDELQPVRPRRKDVINYYKIKSSNFYIFLIIFYLKLSFFLFNIHRYRTVIKEFQISEFISKTFTMNRQDPYSSRSRIWAPRPPPGFLALRSFQHPPPLCLRP